MPPRFLVPSRRKHASACCVCSSRQGRTAFRPVKLPNGSANRPPRRRSISPPWNARGLRSPPGRAARSFTPFASSRLRELIAFLSETCCGGRPELCGDIARLTPLASKEDAPMVPAFNVLFLCTRNSARSIMAEAILQKVGGGRFNAYSAGSDPAPEPMPEVVARLHALGHDVSRLQAKSWDEFMGPNAPRLDFVIALCDTLDGQQCPDFGDKAVTGAWPLPDPAKFVGKRRRTGDPAERAVRQPADDGSRSSSACPSPRWIAWR